MLAARGIATGGKPAFTGLDAAAGESGDARDGFLRDLGERGLACPLLVISDGAAGLTGAAGPAMPGALRGRAGDPGQVLQQRGGLAERDFRAGPGDHLGQAR